MEVKIRVSQLTKKVSEIYPKLSKYVSESNFRMVNKIIPELKDSRRELSDSIVEAEIEGVDSSEPYIRQAIEAVLNSMTALDQGEEFVVNYEDNEIAKSKQKVVNVKLKELCSFLNLFIEWLKNKENSDENRGMKKLKKLREEKINLLCELDEDAQSQVNSIYVKAEKEFEEWVRKLENDHSIKNKECNETKKKPGLKLD